MAELTVITVLITFTLGCLIPGLGTDPCPGCLMKSLGWPVIDWCQTVINACPSGSCQARIKPTTGDVRIVSFDVAQ